MEKLISTKSSKTILAVDDNLHDLQLLIDCFSKTIYKTFAATSGEQAIQTANKIKPDLILLDIMMTGMDGFSTCKQLKANSKTRDIPIIFVTALAETKDKVKGLELGAVDYVIKPLRIEELLLRIKQHLALQSLNQRLTEDIDQQKLLFETSGRIRRSLDLKSILETATAQIRSVLSCDSVWLLGLRNGKNAFLEAYSSSQAMEVGFNDIIPLDYIRQDRAQDYGDDYQKDYDEAHPLYLQKNIQVIENSSLSKLPQKSSLSNARNRLIAPIFINTSQLENPHHSCEDLWGWLIADRNHNSTKWRTKEINLLDNLTTQLAIGIKQGLLHQKIAQQALLDPLTGVYNRRYFNQQLEIEWRRLRRISSSLSLIMCDVDCFKLFNDSYGHQQGDECLKKVAEAMQSVIKRPADIVARYGGEEFVVILPQTSEAGAIKVAEDIRIAIQKLNIPHPNSTVDSMVTASVGIANTIPNAKDKPQLLIEAADLALYQAKKGGRNCVVCYHKPIAHSKAKQDLEFCWVKRLRQALKHNLFSLYAQPITSLEAGDNLKYFEILLRLTDKDEEVVLPNTFLDIAARNHLMPEIDTWVIDSLFEILVTQKTSDYWHDYRFAINLSGASLNQASFLSFLQQKLTSHSLPAELFCFEITESIAVVELDKVTQLIKDLKQIGCSFALDDFGTGISSLSYLKKLPVDYLKIDGSFIRELNTDTSSKVMVEAINHIAEGMGLKTVAEFVENEYILDAVKDLKIDYAQGYHLGRPKALMDLI